MEIGNRMQNYKIETNSEVIYEDGNIWATFIFIKIIGSDSSKHTLKWCNGVRIYNTVIPITTVRGPC